MNIGDIVVRKSYGKDIVFKIIAFSIDEKNEKVAILKGVAFRILADAPIDDLEAVRLPNIRDVLLDKKCRVLNISINEKSKGKRKKDE